VTGAGTQDHRFNCSFLISAARQKAAKLLALTRQQSSPIANHKRGGKSKDAELTAGQRKAKSA